MSVVKQDETWNQDPRESRGHHYSWEKPDYLSWARSWSCPWACWVKGHWLCVHASWGPRWSFLPVSWKSGRNLCVAGSESGSEGKGFSVLACLGLTLVVGGSRGRPGFGLGHGGSFWLEEWCLFDVLCCWHVSILGDIINPGSHRAITLHTVLTHLTEMGTLDRLPQDLATVALPLVSMTPQCTIEWSLFRPGSVLPGCEALSSVKGFPPLPSQPHWATRETKWENEIMLLTLLLLIRNVCLGLKSLYHLIWCLP